MNKETQPEKKECACGNQLIGTIEKLRGKCDSYHHPQPDIVEDSLIRKLAVEFVQGYGGNPLELFFVEELLSTYHSHLIGSIREKIERLYMNGNNRGTYADGANEMKEFILSKLQDTKEKEMYG